MYFLSHHQNTLISCDSNAVRNAAACDTDILPWSSGLGPGYTASNPAPYELAQQEQQMAQTLGICYPGGRSRWSSGFLPSCHPSPVSFFISLPVRNKPTRGSLCGILGPCLRTQMGTGLSPSSSTSDPASQQWAWESSCSWTKSCGSWHPCRGLRWSSWFLEMACSGPHHCRHLRNEAADRSFPVFHSLCLPFNTHTSKRRPKFSFKHHKYKSQFLFTLLVSKFVSCDSKSFLA